MKKWMKDGKFTELTKSQIEDLSVEELAAYDADKNAHKQETLKTEIKELVDKNAEENKDAIATLKEDLQKAQNEALEQQNKTLLAMGKRLTEMAEKESSTGSKEGFASRLKAAFDAQENNFKAALEQNRDTVSFKVDKAEQTYGDITDGEDFAQMRPGVTDIVVRRPRVRSLFSTIPLSTEFYKYVEQETVIRDAQNVAKCAAVVSTTKETLIVRDMHTKVVKDMIDFCRLFVSDYPFMQSRINKLLNESVALRVDDQLLLGTGAGEQTFSIDSYSSEFSAANPVCVLTDKIQDASMVDLILGMQTQIEILGEQEHFMPNVVLVNRCDWFVDVQSRKDLNNNYLDSRVTVINGQPFIGGMLVIPLQNVAANSLYVMDTTKAEVLDRMRFEVEVAFQNKDNWEKEIATIKGLERINLWCPVNWQNAFMKCTDIATAVAAIDKP
jgi:hypothetical protein